MNESALMSVTDWDGVQYILRVARSWRVVVVRMSTSRKYCRSDDEGESSSRAGDKGDSRLADTRTVQHHAGNDSLKGRERERACKSRLDKAGPGRR
jgi:hypothetical protein